MTPRRDLSCLGLLLTLLAAPAARQQVPRLAERVEVSRVVVDVHVLGRDGRPVRGLGPGDFRVRVDGTPVKVEWARWTEGAVALGDAAMDPAAAPPPGPASPGSGRLVLLLIQKDLEASRIEGLMLMLRQAADLVSGLSPADRAGVVVFEHHLELLSDFTTDRRALREILRRSVLLGGQPSAQAAGAAPSLAATFDRAAGRRAASMEQALAVVGAALDGLPGPKAVVVLGHGFGRIIGAARLDTHRVGFDPEYTEARRLLSRARATVYCLDVTRADSHTLEAGLMRTAEDTGGFYLRTSTFPGQAAARIGEALAGHYELSFEKPDLPGGEHGIRVELAGRDGVVFARRTYVG